MAGTNQATNEERMTAAELRSTLRQILESQDALMNEIAGLKEGLGQAAARQSDVQPGEQYRDFEATILVLGYDDQGKQTVKLKGGPFMKFGVRVWEEVLPLLPIDMSKMKPGPNAVQMKVRALMGEQGPRKIVGLAS